MRREEEAQRLKEEEEDRREEAARARLHDAALDFLATNDKRKSNKISHADIARNYKVSQCDLRDLLQEMADEERNRRDEESDDGMDLAFHY